uniref:Serine-type endopeptidase inhibitor n=1 Tax=Davidia involucrata TaxID=16924 RepID=A0A5B7BKA3_DAVIN
MSSFSRSHFSLLTVIVFIGLCFSPTVRSDYNSLAIRLPGEIGGRSDGDLCAGTVAPASCPVNCFRTDPVCGVDGVTYWCGCADAFCAGTRVAKLGFCEVGNGGSGSVSGQALLLVHIVWLILLGISVLFGLL